jgi:hypothetical protein
VEIRSRMRGCKGRSGARKQRLMLDGAGCDVLWR